VSAPQYNEGAHAHKTRFALFGGLEGDRHNA